MTWPSATSLRAQALWSRVLARHDIDWVGEMHSLADSPGFARVIEDREVLVSYPDDDVDAATAGFETMEYWGERAAIWAPIVYGDQVLGMLELTEKERDRTFTHGRRAARRPDGGARRPGAAQRAASRAPPRSGTDSSRRSSAPRAP